MRDISVYKELNPVFFFTYTLIKPKASLCRDIQHYLQLTRSKPTAPLVYIVLLLLYASNPFQE